LSNNSWMIIRARGAPPDKVAHVETQHRLRFLLDVVQVRFLWRLLLFLLFFFKFFLNFCFVLNKTVF